MVRRRVGPMYVLDLRVTECGLRWVHTKVLTRCSVRTEDIASAHDRKAVATCDAAVAGSGSETLTILVVMLVVPIGSCIAVVLTVIVCDNSIAALLLHQENVVFQIWIEGRAADNALEFFFICELVI